LLESRTDIRVLVTDFQMPGSMNGAKLAEAVRNRWPPIKVIVVSGGGLDADITLPTGISYFTKPYKVDALASTIESL
jgi:two-component system, response regulator PdtaR